jgi:uncharacterized OsmC-like protein
MQTATVKWAGGEKYLATMPSGQTIQFDAGSTHRDGPSPMETLLGALGACTSVDVAMILAKKRQKLESLEVMISGERAPSPPQVWTKIEILYRLSGALDEKAVRDAIDLSQQKYCSVAAMLGKTATITYRHEILPRTGGGTLKHICLLAFLWIFCAGKLGAQAPNLGGNWVLRLGSNPLIVLTLRPGSSKDLPFAGSLSRPQHFSVSGTNQFSKIRGPVVRYLVVHSGVRNNCLAFTTQNPSNKTDEDKYRLCSTGGGRGTLQIDVPSFPPWPVTQEHSPVAVSTDWESRAYSLDDSDTPNPQMQRIFERDQRARQIPFQKIDWTVVSKVDAARRDAVRKLLVAGNLHTGEDFERAAIVFQHGDTPDDYLLAHTLAMIAIAQGDPNATWIASASLDRYLQSIHQPQIYGTQFDTAKKTVTQDPYNRALISDSLRSLLGVPSMAAQEEQTKKYESEMSR